MSLPDLAIPRGFSLRATGEKPTVEPWRKKSLRKEVKQVFAKMIFYIFVSSGIPTRVAGAVSFGSLPCAEPELLRSVSFSKMSSPAPEAMG